MNTKVGTVAPPATCRQPRRGRQEWDNQRKNLTTTQRPPLGTLSVDTQTSKTSINIFEVVLGLGPDGQRPHPPGERVPGHQVLLPAGGPGDHHPRGWRHSQCFERYLLFIDFCVNISCSCTKSKYSLPFRCWSKEGISSFFSMFSIKATSLRAECAARPEQDTWNKQTEWILRAVIICFLPPLTTMEEKHGRKCQTSCEMAPRSHHTAAVLNILVGQI